MAFEILEKKTIIIFESWKLRKTYIVVEKAKESN